MGARAVIATSEGTHREAFGPVEWGLLLTIGIVWGSSFLLMAIGLESFRPGLITFLRLGFGAMAIALAPGSRRRVAREDWPRIAFLAVVWMAAPLVLFPLAQDLGLASSRAGMINGAMPLFAAAIAAMLLRRLPGPRQALGLAIGFIGVVLITVPSANGPAGSAIGALLALIATVCYGLAANVAVPLQQKYGALPVVLRAQLVALLLVTPFGALSVPGSDFSWPSFLSILVLGMVGTGIAFIMMTTLVGRAGATRGAVAIYFIPVVALILGVTLRNETVSAVALIGVILVLLGAWVTSRRESRGRRGTSPPAPDGVQEASSA